MKNFVTLNIDVPNDTEKLDNIEKYIKTLGNRFKLSKNGNKFNKKVYDEIDNFAVETLIMLGELSLPAFDVMDELEKKYILLYPDSPVLAKQMWLEHYDKLHYRYDLLKNRCYKLIDDMNEELQKNELLTRIKSNAA